MKRVLCIWLPNWSLQRVRSERPELKHQPLVLYRNSARGIFEVAACTQRALQQGVTPGMPLAEAKSLLERAVFSDASGKTMPACFQQQDPRADLASLQKLAEECQHYSPLVGVEEADVPETLFLDVTGCAPLFGGEPSFTKHVQREFRNRGFQIRIGLACTIGAAWAVAHHCRDLVTILKPTDGNPWDSDALNTLPIEALRLNEKTIQTLHELNLRSIGQLQALPRSELPSRFGQQVIDRLDQALGRAVELIVPQKSSEPVRADWSYETPVSDRRAIEAALKQLVQRIAGQLALRREGVQQLFCRLESPQGEPVICSVGLVRGSASPDHLLELLFTQLERVRLTSDISEIRLLAGSVVPLELRQEHLFAGELDADIGRELALLVDRLSNRLGHKCVLRARLCPDAQPEYAVEYEPWISTSDPPGSGPSRSHEPLPGWRTFEHCRVARPLLLKPKPAAIDVLSVVPDGPPIRFEWKNREHLIARSWGPERIETGWWRHRPVRRDYYRVETTSGQRFWLFRSLEKGDWFLQGEFG